MQPNAKLISTNNCMREALLAVGLDAMSLASKLKYIIDEEKTAYSLKAIEIAMKARGDFDSGEAEKNINISFSFPPEEDIDGDDIE